MIKLSRCKYFEICLVLMGLFSLQNSYFLGDSLANNNGMKFSTKDQDTSGSCAKTFHAGWWFKACFKANPNGMYRKTAVKTTQSVNWYHFGNEHRALKKIRFMIRLK